MSIVGANKENCS